MTALHRYTVPWNNVALTAGTERTVCQIITPSTRKARLVELWVSMDGVSSTQEPSDWRILRQTTAGSGGSAVTPRPDDPDMPAALSSANVGMTSEPTLATNGDLRVGMCHPQAGFMQQLPLGREIILDVSDRLGIAITARGTNVNTSGYAVFEE